MLFRSVVRVEEGESGRACMREEAERVRGAVFGDAVGEGTSSGEGNVEANGGGDSNVRRTRARGQERTRGNFSALQGNDLPTYTSIQRKEGENHKRSAGSTKEAIYMQKKRDNSERSVEK